MSINQRTERRSDCPNRVQPACRTASAERRAARSADRSPACAVPVWPRLRDALWPGGGRRVLRRGVLSRALKALAKRRSAPLCCTVKPDSSTASATLCSAASDTSPAGASPLAPG
jgi:hypothetical protein